MQAAALAMLAFLASALAQPAPEARYVHLSLSTDPTMMFVQWRGGDAAPISDATVQWGAAPGRLTQSSNGTAWSFTDGGRTYYLARATMSGLTPGQVTYYAVGGDSTVYNFTATRAHFSEAAPLRLAWFGDLGWQNAQALPYLIQEAAAGAFDHFIHVGGALPAPPLPH